MIRYLSEADVRSLLSAAELDAALRDALCALSNGEAVAPPRVSAHSPNGLVGAMPGFVPGMGMAAKLVTVFPGNHSLGLPSHQGIVVVFDPETGTLEGLLDAAAITTIRTAQTAVIAADLLARHDATTLTILGAGALGGEHLAALSGTRAWTDIRIASRTRSHAERIAGADQRARVVESFEDAVRGAHVICCCTDAADPVINASWVEPGAHVSSVGRRHELPTGLIEGGARGPVFVEWRGAALFPPPAGAMELQVLAATSDRDLVELGELLQGHRPGRERSEQITVYKSTGHAVEDLAAACVALKAAAVANRGHTLPTHGSMNHAEESP